MYVAGCEGENINRRLCQSDYDCQVPSMCGVDGYCVVPGEGSNDSGEYTCRDACETLIRCCEMVTGQEKIDCEPPDYIDSACRERYGTSCLTACVQACEQENWSRTKINCLGDLYCESTQDTDICR